MDQRVRDAMLAVMGTCPGETAQHVTFRSSRLRIDGLLAVTRPDKYRHHECSELLMQLKPASSAQKRILLR